MLSSVVFWGEGSEFGLSGWLFSYLSEIQGKTWIEPSANLTRSYSLEDNTENKPFT